MSGFHYLEGGSLETVVPPPSIDPQLSLQLLETPQQRLNLGQSVVLLDVFYEDVVSVLFVKLLWRRAVLWPEV